MPDKFPEPADLQKFFENWWRTGSTIVTTIAAALSSLQMSSPANYIVATSLTIAGLAVAVLLYRRDARRRETAEETKRDIEHAQLTAASAFRGLRRFLRGDILPGSQRRRQAAQLFHQIVHPEFKIALVTGESGAGKSSLLECAIVKTLEVAGHPVVMISNSSRLGLSDPTTSNLSKIEAVISDVAVQIAKHRTEGSKATVIIFDQFEELLSRFRSKSDRSQLGDFLWKSITDGIRIVIGIRKEYVIDVQSVTASFGYSVRLEDTFLVENFDVEEAAAVIQECATQDAIKFDADLPKLISEDLAIDDRVRPADLQIVCTALSGNLTLERYKSEGRAVGLRSRFVRGVIDITGDAVLARAVLRQLCDIPNNKKASEPLAADDIAEKARAGAAGERATHSAVTAILRALEQARVVIVIDGLDKPRWSLIHDYLVESIKLATEVQNTLSEAAAARLDYFVTRARTFGSAIPLSDLRLIRRDAPPTALQQPAARNLIRRSLFIGYGAPALGALGVAIMAVLLVVFSTTERQWRVVDEKSHWDGVPPGEERSGVVFSWSGELDGRLKKQTTIFHDPFGVSRLTSWDTETGDFLGAQSGKLVGNSILNYDAATGQLSKRDATGAEINIFASPPELRPLNEVDIESFHEPLVYFSDELSSNIARRIYNTKTNKWTVISLDKIAPVSTSPERRVERDVADTKLLYVHLLKGDKSARLTIWTADYEHLLFDETNEIDDARKNAVRILGLTDLGARTILSLTDGKTITGIPIYHPSGNSNGASSKFAVGNKREISLPIDLKITARRDAPRFARQRQVISALGKRIVIVEPSAKRTFFWIFNPGTMSFDEPIIGAQSASFQGVTAGYAWMPEDDGGPTRFWFEDSLEPVRISTIRIRSKDRIEISSDKRRALLISNENIADLWNVDFTGANASFLKRIAANESDRLFFSDDGQLLIRRQPGGLHQVWDRNGSSLGSIGILGSEMRVSSYRAKCRQILVWNSEGQRLDLRRGFNIPLVGFIPERDCSLELPNFHKLIRTMLARIVS